MPVVLQRPRFHHHQGYIVLLRGGSVEFAKLLVREGKVAVSPGLGFGPFGDDHVRFALIENAHRTKQAVKGIKKALSTAGSGLQADEE